MFNSPLQIVKLINYHCRVVFMLRKTGRKTVFSIFAITLLIFTVLANSAIAASDPEIVIDDDYCAAEYTDYYKCDGSLKTRLYQKSDCSREWRISEQCEYGCSDGECLKCPSSAAEAEVLPVSDMFEGNTIKPTVKIHNTAENGRKFFVRTYLCRAGDEDENCVRMECDMDELHVGSDRVRYVDCWKTIKRAGVYELKVSYTTDPDFSSSINTACHEYERSNVFKVFGEYEAEDIDFENHQFFIDEYRCFGSYRQQKYSTIDDGESEWRWKNVDFCTEGCTDGECIQPEAQTSALTQFVGEPDIFTQANYDAKRCKLSEIPFSITNSGQSDNFEIEVSGSAEDWIDVAPTVFVSKDKTQQLTAFASIPCDAMPGDHEFTITASGRTEDSRTTIISIPEPVWMFNTISFADVLLLFAVAAGISGYVILKRQGLSIRFNWNLGGFDRFVGSGRTATSEEKF